MRGWAGRCCAAAVVAAVAGLAAGGEGDDDAAAAPEPVDSPAFEAEWRPVWETSYDERVARDPRGHDARADVLVLPYPVPVDPDAWPDWFPERAPAPRFVAEGEALTDSRRRSVWRVLRRSDDLEAYLAERETRYAERDVAGLVA